ncbi:hypothetical protein AGMMS49982_08980 [Bacteroidia bacterium]|nr:hypothetical protein AGMMS49982_08980 [Bacteroidia bacterium]
MKRKLNHWVISSLYIGICCFCNLQKSEAQQVISARDLYRNTLDNQAAFDVRYKNKTIRVKGIVCKITPDHNDEKEEGYSVLLYTGTDIIQSAMALFDVDISQRAIGNVEGCKVSVFFKESYKSQLNNINSDDEIIVQGKCTHRGRLLDKTVYLNHCSLISHKSRAQMEKEAEQQRLKEAQEREREKNRQRQRELMSEAVAFVGTYAFESALASYQQALTTSPENQTIINAEVKALTKKIQQYNDFVAQANNFDSSRNYAQAKQAWQKAYNIKPIEEIKKKMDEDDRMLLFLKERPHTIHDLETLDSSEYSRIEDKLLSTTKKTLSTGNITGNGRFSITYNVDTMGVKSASVVGTSGSSSAIGTVVKQAADGINLKPESIYGYTVLYKSEHNIDVKIEDKEVFKAEKHGEEIKIEYGGLHYEKEISSAIGSGEPGDYKVEVQKMTINGEDFSQSRVVKYKYIETQVWLEYEYSKAAPLGLTLGVCRLWGGYIRYKADVQLASEKPSDGKSGKYIVQQEQKTIFGEVQEKIDFSKIDFDEREYYRFAVTGGVMFRPFNHCYLYGGAGYGVYGTAYQIVDTDAYYCPDLQKGLEVEGGVVIRLGYVSLSGGYSTLLLSGSKQRFSDVNVGFGFMF